MLYAVPFRWSLLAGLPPPVGGDLVILRHFGKPGEGDLPANLSCQVLKLRYYLPHGYGLNVASFRLLCRLALRPKPRGGSVCLRCPSGRVWPGGNRGGLVANSLPVFGDCGAWGWEPRGGGGGGVGDGLHACDSDWGGLWVLSQSGVCRAIITCFSAIK